MKIRIASENPVFGYKGQLFTKTDGQGNPVDYSLPDELAQELLDLEDSPFRAVDDDGNVVPNAVDLAKVEAAQKSANAREFVVPSTRTEVTVPPEGEPEAKEKKKIVIGKKAKDETPPPPGPVIEQKAEEIAALQTDGSVSDTGQTGQQEPEVSGVDNSTEGAVEV